MEAQGSLTTNEPFTKAAQELFAGKDNHDDADPFAQLGEVGDERNHIQFDETETDSSRLAHSLPDSPVVKKIPHYAEVGQAERDYSDLLAEFEGGGQDLLEENANDASQTFGLLSAEDQDDHIPTSGVGNLLDRSGKEQVELQNRSEDRPDDPSPSSQDSPGLSSAPGVAGLWGDDCNGSSPFDDLLVQTGLIPLEPSADSTPAESPVPNLSIENSQHDARLLGVTDEASGETSMQSLFSNASDWLADTTMEDSFAIGGDEDEQTVQESGSGDLAQNDNDVASLDVPEGWYDEREEWHWYTEEEKEQVRLTMLDQGAWTGKEVREMQPEQIEQGEVFFP